MSKLKKAILFLILANIIWGASFPIYKWTLTEIQPFTFAFLRFVIAAILILPFTYKNLRVDKKDIPLLILASIISITLSIPIMLFGLKLSPSINAPIIVSSSPIFLIIASALFLKDIVKTKVLIGTIVSLVGILIIMFRPFAVGGFTGLVLGNLLIFISMLCGIAQTLILKKLMNKNEPLTIVFWSFIIGSLPLLIPIALFEPNIGNINFFSTPVIIGIAYAAILSSAIAHYFSFFGIKYLPASEIGIFSYVDPIATIIIAIPLLSEKITSLYMLGAFFVFFGIFIAEERIHYHSLHRLFKKG